MTRESSEAVAREAIGALLDGEPPCGVDPARLGIFAEGYVEMCRAYEQGGTKAACIVFAAYARQNPAYAALRAGDADRPKAQWNTAELLAADFPPPKWLVPNYLCEGLTIFAGRPKIGKSWAALQMAVAVGSGGVVFGESVPQNKVLYLALEDNERRVQDRLRKQQVPKKADIVFCFKWPSLNSAGAAELTEEIDKMGYGLVVIDTLARALDHADPMDQVDMNVTLGRLQRIALDRHIAILLIDHHRKTGMAGAGDVIDDVMGATSKAGVADGAMGIYRVRGEKNAVLKISGRDIDDREIALQWDAALYCWQMVGDAAAVQTRTVQAEIVSAIQEHGGEANCKEIAHWLNKSPGNVNRELTEMVAKGILVRGERKGRTVPYKLPKP